MISSWCAEKRPAGCPAFTYGRGIYKALKKVNEAEGWSDLAQNRADWSKAISQIT